MIIYIIIYLLHTPTQCSHGTTAVADINETHTPKQIKSDRFTYPYIIYMFIIMHTDATMNNSSAAEAQIVFYSR